MSNATRVLQRACVTVGVLATMWMASPQTARAEHVHCHGDWEGYLFDYYQCDYDDESCCYAWGHWHVDIDTHDGAFNFHFHGDTNDEECFGLKVDEYGYPNWVADLLYYECGFCIDYYDAETYVHISDLGGHVFLKVTGYAYPCGGPS